MGGKCCVSKIKAVERKNYLRKNLQSRTDTAIAKPECWKFSELFKRGALEKTTNEETQALP